MTGSFVHHHNHLLRLYLSCVRSGATNGLTDELCRLGQVIRDANCAHSLVAFDRYVRMIALCVGNDILTQPYAIYDLDHFEKMLRKDPSHPAALMGTALACVHGGDLQRGRHLLRRLAASHYFERHMAGRLLNTMIQDVAGE